MSARRRKVPHPPAKKPPTPDDAWAASAREQCARAMAAWLKQTINTRRPINTLSLAEMNCLAETAVATWLVAASKRRPEPFSDVDSEILFLLI